MNQQNTPTSHDFREAAGRIIEIGRNCYERGWTLGTSGNFSAVLNREPLRLAITSSGVDKGRLTPGQILEIDDHGKIVSGEGKPSDETLLHLAIVRSRGAGAVLHTHSVWSTLLSQNHADVGGLTISGYEMLKGLAGVKTHEHSEWIPILDNSQDMASLAKKAEDLLQTNPQLHAILLRGHGLYTWGLDLNEAGRHVEILEFLLEVQARS